MIKRYLDFELKIYSNDKEIEIDIDGRPYGFSLPERLKLPLVWHVAGATARRPSRRHPWRGR